MRFLIFETNDFGHHFEYVNHQLNYAAQHSMKDYFIFVLSSGFADKLYKFSNIEYDNNNNIEIIFIEPEISSKLKSCSFIKKSLILSRLIKKYRKEYKADKVILNEMITTLPFLTFYNKKICSIRGIIYKIPSRRINANLKTRIKDKFIYNLIRRSRAVDTVWLLNDTESSDKYNSIYNTDIFRPLPDPINVTEQLNNDIIDKYKDSDKIILFHGGGMGSRKGTFDITEALSLMTDEQLGRYIVIFAGHISDNNENRRLKKFITDFQNRIDIVYTDSFISFEDLCSYIAISDYILIPYKNIEQSSGILGYAAFYDKPVIGPEEGLLGHLIQKYDLGITIKGINPNKLCCELSKIPSKDYIGLKTKEYVEANQIEKFASEIFHR